MAFRKFPLAALLTIALLPPAALAALGGDVPSVQSDQSRLQAVRRATLSNGYTIHELTTANGLTVREYATVQGRIFAVSWQGPFMPDLQQLLGAYFPSFKLAVDERRAAGWRGPVSIRQDDLVVQSGGRMRAFSGRAWVPSLLPPQVAAEQIQ